MKVNLKNAQKITLRYAIDIYSVMQLILKRENKIERNKEHFWTISLNNAQKILNIELVSIGTANKTLVEPVEVFSVPLQKQAVTVVLIHNHPSGNILPSESDQDITDRLIQVGRIMRVPVLDHVIITEESFYSFRDTGLLAQLEKSTKYVPPYELKERYRQEMEKEIEKMEKEKKKEIEKRKKEIEKIRKKEAEKMEKEVERMEKEIEKMKKEIAKNMLRQGLHIEAITQATGLRVAQIKELENDDAL
ncbi:MAG: JAB domain-containing protein [Cytophagales bacterium]|nr:JAB domain-containing protein [Cytophagales bacterium]